MRQMKESGIEWIGEIPQEWDVRRIKFTLDEHSGGSWGTNEGESEIDCVCVRVADFNYPKLSVDFHDKMTVRSYANKAIEEGCIKSGDILLEKSGGGDITPVGRSVLFESNEQMMCANFIEWLRPNQHFDSRFLNYWLAAAYVNGFSKRNIKQTTGIQNLDVPAFLSERIAAPVVDVQVAIADYLDRKCAEIDVLIAAKEKTNALLRERRQSIIYEAVTKGLNPNAPMKDSGIEWIGEIPAHWGFSKLKYDAYMKGRIGWQGLKADEFIEEGPYLVTGTDFEDGKIQWERSYHISDERFDEAPEIHLQEQDLLITKDGTIGKLAYVDYLPGPASLNSHLLVIRPKNKRFINKYLYWVLSSDVFLQYTEYAQDGTIMASLSQEKISRFVFGLPSIAEQQAVVDYLDNRCEEMDALISANESTIQKLKEYRQSIIYEAVTGKIAI